MAKKTLNIALFGTGFMGRTHSNAYLKVSKFFKTPIAPVMYAAVDPVGADGFAANWGWQKTATDWKAAIKDEDIDLVDICTPNHQHAPIAIAALEAGKHVACEKPLAGTLAEARQMRDAARKARKSVTHVWFSYRGTPAQALAHQMVKQGKIGRIYHVRAQYLQDWGGPDTPLLWRFRGKDAGSGAHGDLNAHIIDACRFITGEEVTEVCGAINETFIKERAIPEQELGNIKGGKVSKKARMGKVTVDDAVLFLARLSGGGVASFEATRLATGRKNANCIEINGEKGSLRWDFEDMNLLWYYNAEDDNQRAGWQRIMCTDAGAHPYAHAWWPDAHILGYEHGFVNLAGTLLNNIAGRKVEVPAPDFEDAYQTQRVLEAAILSAKNRSWIKLREVK